MKGGESLWTYAQGGVPGSSVVVLREGNTIKCLDGTCPLRCAWGGGLAEGWPLQSEVLVHMSQTECMSGLTSWCPWCMAVCAALFVQTPTVCPWHMQAATGCFAPQC
jgi:hypothetical protein